MLKIRVPSVREVANREKNEPETVAQSSTNRDIDFQSFGLIETIHAWICGLSMLSIDEYEKNLT